jgi:hypothetical protein
MWICSECGVPRTRLVEWQEYQEAYGGMRLRFMGKSNSCPVDPETSGRHDIGRRYIPRKPVTDGWSDCGHNAWVPGTVLDPFAGSGTTGEVALKLGRSFIGIDLYSEFREMAERRCRKTLRVMELAGLNPQALER